jgi:hypothetical protein
MSITLQKIDTTDIEKYSIAVKNLSASSILTALKNLLCKSVYEDGDFRVRDGKVYVDLCYDAKGVSDYYKMKIREMFPDNALIKGTKIVIQIKHQKGTLHEKSNGVSIKKDRRAGESKKSSARDANDTH